jgi:glycosyltransferase involved in cell wall biosynthesis
MDPRLTIVIPALNEALTIGDVVKRLAAECAPLIKEVVVVDDGSSDATGELAAAAGARVIRHKRNLGYGAALKTGIASTSTEYVLLMDGDGQHRAEDVARLWNAADGADMVVGQRIKLLHSPLWRMPGKWLLTIVSNYLTGRRIPDLNSGFRLLRRETALKYLHLCPSGFSFSTTITMTLLCRGYDVAFVPIDIQPRMGISSVSLTTGFETLVLVLRVAVLFNPMRMFIPISLMIGALGVAWGVPYMFLGRGVSVGAMLAIVTALLLFGLGLVCDQVSQMRLERFE